MQINTVFAVIDKFGQFLIYILSLQGLNSSNEDD